MRWTTHRGECGRAIQFALGLYLATQPGLAAAQLSDAEEASAPGSVAGTAQPRPVYATQRSLRTAADVAKAVLPSEARGVRVEPNGPPAVLWLPRAILVLPRWALELAMAAPRGLLWTYDRFQIAERWKSIFFNDEGTIGIFPVAFVETGFGLNAGVRLFHRDLFGHAERFRIRASYGGRFRQLYSAKLTTGELLGRRTILTVEGDYQIFPKSRFYGIGNRDEQEATAIAGLINPLDSRTSVKTRFAHNDGNVALAIESQPTNLLRLRLASAWRHREFTGNVSAHDDPELTEIYATEGLVGYQTGLRNIYIEAEIAIDTRRTTEFYMSRASPSTGWHLTSFLGRRQGLGNDPSAHWRYGLDLQRYFDLFAGDRVLLLRAYVEGVTGDLDKVSFVDLPQLGGPAFLRGYGRERFRDRIVTMGTVEYSYPVIRSFAGYLFIDAGRVWRSYERMRAEGFRIGFGGGIQMHTVNSFLARVFVASSIDGGIQFNLSFDPIFDARSREESP